MIASGPLDSELGERQRSQRIYTLRPGLTVFQNRQQNTFGQLLKFWRATFGYSQEHLASILNISNRHISFLETGRAQPNPPLIHEIGRHMKLGPRDLGNLMMAAGFLPYSEAADLESPEHAALRDGLRLTLRSFDPFPAAVIDPCANVKMVNRAWVRSHRRVFGDAIMRREINTIRMIVDPKGWRAFMPNWIDMACLYLVILQQEAIMRASDEAAQLMAEILAVEGLPDDWAMRGLRMSPTGSNHSEIRRVRGVDRAYVNVHHTVGSTAWVSEPRLLIHALIPQDGIADATVDELYADALLDHPLIAT